MAEPLRDTQGKSGWHKEDTLKNILFIASECVPFIKTGGLADVVGSLPKYFDKKDFDVRVMIPKYACIPEVKNELCNTFLY